MKNNFKVGFIIAVAVIIILAGAFVYVWKSKSAEIERLNTEVAGLNADIQSKDEAFAVLDKNLKLVLRSVGVGEHTALASGQNYNKYFADPYTPDLPPKLKTFLIAECPAEIYSVPDKLVRTYSFDMNAGQFVFNVITEEGPFGDILCSYIYNPAVDSYAKP